MYNTFRAHQLIDWAGAHGKEHETNLALFGAFFTHRRDVSDVEVLGDVAALVGLIRDETIAML
jgi:predicted DsbA family dithiol-disulfide isomerase